MAGDTITMTALAFAKAMTNRVARERERIAKFLDQRADAFEGGASMDTYPSQLLRELAEAIRSGEGAGVQLAPYQAATTENRDEIDEAVQRVVDEGDPLPPDGIRSDEEDALGLLRSRAAFGRPITQLRDE